MSKVAKNAVIIMALSIFCKVFGFMREIALSALYGVSSYGGIYLAVLSIPDIVFALIGSCIMTTFIPLYYEVKNNEGSLRADKFLNNIFNISVLVSLVITFFGMIFTEEVVKVFAMGFKGEEFEIAVRFTKILMIGGFFTGICGVINAYLNIKGDFVIPTIVSIPYNAVVISFMFVSVIYNNPYIMVVATTVGIFFKFLLQFIFAIKKGYKYKPTIDLKDEYLIKMLKLSAPILIGVGVNQVNAMADKTLATTFGVESISALSYANKLNIFVMGIFIVSLSSVIYPRLSELLIDDNKEGFTSIVTKSINMVIVFILPISAGSIILAEPIVSILFERGMFDANATKMTAMALATYSIGMIAYSLRDILNKIFYALKDTKIPMTNGMIAVALNIAMNFYFSSKFGYVGLSLATSMSSIISVIILFVRLHKKVGYFGQRMVVVAFLKSIFSVSIMSVVVYVVYYKLLAFTYSQLLSLIVSVVLGGGVYFLLMYILKAREVDFVIDLIEKIKNNIRNRIVKLFKH